MSAENKHLTKEEAIDFFARFYNGQHHIPGGINAIKEWGFGWCVSHTSGGISTYDFDRLTKFVVMCHDLCYRGEIVPVRHDIVKIVIHKRKREGGTSERHPTMEEALLRIRNY